MKKTKNAVLTRSIATALALATLCFSGQALAGVAYRNYDDPAGTPDQKLYAANYELDTDLWGLYGETGQWHLKTYTSTDPTKYMDGSGWNWSGFTATKSSGVVGFPSIQRGATNDNNDPSASGLPYALGDNSKTLNLTWDFTASGSDGTGDISGRYNQVIDVFFSSQTTFDTSKLGLEIMIIPNSSSDSQTGGWGFHEADTFVIDNETWDVWTAIQDVSGSDGIVRRWPVIQFRARQEKHLRQEPEPLFRGSDQAPCGLVPEHHQRAERRYRNGNQGRFRQGVQQLLPHQRVLMPERVAVAVYRGWPPRYAPRPAVVPCPANRYGQPGNDNYARGPPACAWQGNPNDIDENMEIQK